MLKAQVRKEVLQRRATLSDNEFEALNNLLLEQFTTIDFSSFRSVHFFLPIVKNREPNTFLMIDWLEKHHPEITIVVSKSNFSTHTMSNHPYLGKADLVSGKFEIPEPKTKEFYEGEIDLVLVPLLAFDEQGYRVGYGKGFYDRFLAGRTAFKVGVALFDPIKSIKDVHLGDIKLDLCISPKQIYTFVK